MIDDNENVFWFLSVGDRNRKGKGDRYPGHLLQRLQVGDDGLGVGGLELVSRHGRIGRMAARSGAGLEKLDDALLAPTLPQTATGSQIGRGLVPAFHFLGWLEVEGRALEPPGLVEFTGFEPGGVTLLAFPNFFNEVLSIGDLVGLRAKAQGSSDQKQAKNSEHAHMIPRLKNEFANREVSDSRHLAGARIAVARARARGG